MQPNLQDAIIQYQNGGRDTAIQSAVNNLGQGLSSVSSSPTGASFNASSFGSVKTPSPSSLNKFTGFLGDLGKETGNIAMKAGSWLTKQVVNMAEAPIKLGAGIGHGILDNLELNNISQQRDQLSAKMQTLQDNYKSGKISKEDYTLSLKDLSQDFSSLSKDSQSLADRANFDQKSATSALINTASDLVTILTAGFGKAVSTGVNITGKQISLDATSAKTASDYLASKAATPLLSSVEQTISRVASQPEVFKSLDATTQALLQRSTAEVISNAGQSMTAGQIARATATNVALKYPMFYSFTSDSAQQIYQELDQKKYGDAVRTMAFNASLLLSGGPIGHALKYGGDVVKGVSASTFGKTSFWDELSKFYGGQQTDGFVQAIRKISGDMNPAEQQQFIRNLASVEATNVAAMGGDAAAAAYRVAKGMQGEYAFNLSEVTHEDAVHDMVKYAENFRRADQAAKDAGLGQVAVGRLDARDKSVISQAVNQGIDKESRLQAWEDWKQNNPNSAAANNANFDKQIKQIIARNSNEGGIDTEIRAIKAQTTIEGFPQNVTKQLAKDGYVPIRPANLEAPFAEGGDKLATKFAGKDNFFVKAVPPVPILSSVGSLLTRLGMSPNASQSLTYEMFNDNLSRNLVDSNALKKMAFVGESREQTADTIVKELSNFSHGTKLPTKDLRQLTNKQVQKALGVGAEDAREVQNAIANAHLQVPLAVRGLGDRAVDWSYRLPASSSVMKRYMKIQGALRFAYNPFFQYLRVIPKTEILTEAEGGGLIRSIFVGRTNEIKGIRTALRDGGYLDTPGAIGNLNTADDQIGIDVGRNITKKLLPAQEVSIAGLIDAQAQRVGMNAQEYMQQYPSNVRDTVQGIVEYDRKGNFINSPMARTLNVAFFPFRFDTKVATIFARNLGKTDLVTQVSVIHGVMKAHDFLQSPEGQAWYAQNSTALGLINYITPIASMSEVFQSLLPGHDHSLGNFGELGGLPFGWIPSLLDAEGLTHFNQPGMNAKTGEMFPSYVPVTDKGQLAIAVQDFIGALFSYPGAEVGLPSKGSITRSLAIGLTGANKNTDLSLNTPQPNAEQASYAAAIGGSQPTNTIPGAPNTQVTNVPSQNLPAVQPRSKGSAKRKKESEYAPTLLPGQTSVGVIPGA